MKNAEATEPAEKKEVNLEDLLTEQEKTNQLLQSLKDLLIIEFVVAIIYGLIILFH